MGPMVTLSGFEPGLAADEARPQRRRPVSIPQTNPNAPFNVTRASHAVLTVKDLGASRAFYVDAIGLVVSDETKDALYLRGVEEACHHSLVLRRTDAPPVCERVGLRVYTEDDLEKAKLWFDQE